MLSGGPGTVVQSEAVKELLAEKDWAALRGTGLLALYPKRIGWLVGLSMVLAVWGVGVYRGGFELAAVVALTIVLAVVVGSLIGVSPPFLLDRFKFDPATASGTLITSLSDIAGLLIYFSIATRLLDL